MEQTLQSQSVGTAPEQSHHSLAVDLKAPTLSRAYQCQCGRPIFLGNSECLASHMPLGYVVESLGALHAHGRYGDERATACAIDHGFDDVAGAKGARFFRGAEAQSAELSVERSSGGAAGADAGGTACRVGHLGKQRCTEVRLHAPARCLRVPAVSCQLDRAAIRLTADRAAGRIDQAIGLDFACCVQVHQATSNAGSFFGTDTLLSVTYTGKPSRYAG